MKHFALTCLLSTVASGQQAQAVLPEVGDPAPALHFDHVLGADAAAIAPDALRGKVVVIEFAASWCGGCRAAAPHWNELAAALAQEPIVFLCATNEDQATAERFRAEVALTTPQGVDLDGSIFEAFGVGGLPDVVVLGKDGRIAAFTHPRGLTANALKRLLAGAPPAFARGAPRMQRHWNHRKPLGDAAVSPGTFSLAPSPRPAGVVRNDPKTGTIRAAGVPLAVLCCNALDCDKSDLELDPALDAKTLYDLVARGTDDTLAGARAVAREGLLRDCTSSFRPSC